jgi:hypothetical protein
VLALQELGLPHVPHVVDVYLFDPWQLLIRVFYDQVLVHEQVVHPCELVFVYLEDQPLLIALSSTYQSDVNAYD